MSPVRLFVRGSMVMSVAGLLAYFAAKPMSPSRLVPVTIVSSKPAPGLSASQPVQTSALAVEQALAEAKLAPTEVEQVRTVLADTREMILRVLQMEQSIIEETNAEPPDPARSRAMTEAYLDVAAEADRRLCAISERVCEELRGRAFGLAISSEFR